MILNLGNILQTRWEQFEVTDIATIQGTNWLFPHFGFIAKCIISLTIRREMNKKA